VKCKKNMRQSCVHCNNVLLRSTVLYSTWRQCPSWYCTVIQYTVLYCTVIQYTVLYCNVLYLRGHQRGVAPLDLYFREEAVVSSNDGSIGSHGMYCSQELLKAKKGKEKGGS